MRSASPEERRRRRQLVIALRRAGHSLSAIAARTGLSRTGVFDICRRVEGLGPAALDDAPRPRQRSQLGEQQAAVVRATLATRTPDELSLTLLLWTPAGVTEWIARRTGVRLSVRNTALKLRQWGYRPPRPMAKARLRDAAAAARWQADTYPALVARARAEGAELAWVDVSPLCGPAAAAAPASVATGDPSRSVFSTVDNRGRMRWAVFAGPLDGATFVELLRRRLHGADRKLVLIVDPLRLHRSALVRQWLAEREDRVEVVGLPGKTSPSTSD